MTVPVDSQSTVLTLNRLDLISPTSSSVQQNLKQQALSTLILGSKIPHKKQK